MQLRLRIAAAILATALASPALAEHWVTAWQVFEIDTDSLSKDANGKTVFHERVKPPATADELPVKAHMVDCATRQTYALMFDRWRRSAVQSADDKAALDLICGKTPAF